MTTLKNIVFGCVSDHGADSLKVVRGTIDKPLAPQRVRFGLPLEEAFKDNVLPIQLMDMLIYIARDGITTTDLFRRPGNPNDLKQIVKRLSDGKDIDYANYNFYTLASVIKKFLLKIPGGVFGPEAEYELLNILNIKERIQQFDAINKVIKRLPKVSQELTSMLFGTWFRMSHHSEFNCMSSESVAKSVAGSLFHTCADDPNMVNLASNVLQLLIDNFAASSVFGRDNIEFFAQATKTKIDVLEKYKYELDTNILDIFGNINNEEKNGVLTVNKVTSIEECFALFEKVVAHDVKARGIDPMTNAISSAKLRDSESHHQISYPVNRLSNQVNFLSTLPMSHFPKTVSATPSFPQPYQSLHRELDLQECSSLSSYLSAPDVYEATTQHHPSNSEILTKSLSRVESVYRKQLMRLRQRNKWFLNCLPTSTYVNARVSGLQKDPALLNSETSCLSSSFSCGILSNNNLGNTVKSEGTALGEQTNNFKYEKTPIISCTDTSSFNSMLISTTSTVGPSSLSYGIPASKSEESKFPKYVSTIPHFSISNVNPSESTFMLTPYRKNEFQRVDILPNTHVKNLPQSKYFQIQHCYGIISSKDIPGNDTVKYKEFDFVAIC